MNWFQVLKSRLKYNPLQTPSKNKGIALILAATSLVMMVYIATEVSKDSLTEYAVNSHELNRIKTYYAARSGMQIALLRVKLFQQASRFNLPPGFAKELDKIWTFPFAWPLPVSKEVNAVDQDAIAQVTKESFMDASYTHTIEDEGTKIDINDLVSPSKTLQKITQTQILNIFQQKIESDDNFRDTYQSFRFEELINRIIDFMSETNSAAGQGGDKKSAFSELGESYPPNRGFRTIDELRLIPGMNEEFFQLLSSRITIYGMKAINPNTASAEVLKSLDPAMTDEAVKAAIERRNDPEKGGPFVGEKEKCRDGFKEYVKQNGAQRISTEFDQIPMICDKVINFRIKSTGVFGQGKNAMMKNIEVVVIDLGRSASQIKSFLDEEKKQAQQQQQGQPPANGGSPPPANSNPAGSKSGSEKQEPLPKGPPRVVYWTEY